jgi:hypothetical protein
LRRGVALYRVSTAIEAFAQSAFPFDQPLSLKAMPQRNM